MKAAKRQEGVVVSHKMQKTIVVAVERRAQDDQFKKIIKESRHFKVHDETDQCQVGDRVQIIETRPLSKQKRWRVEKVLEKAVL